MEIPLIEVDMVFKGAGEYFAFLGLEAGYYETMTEEGMYDYVLGWVMPGLPCRPETESCYILGFLLGTEIIKSEKKDEKKRPEIRKSSVRSRKSQSEIDRPRTSME